MPFDAPVILAPPLHLPHDFTPDVSCVFARWRAHIQGCVCGINVLVFRVRWLGCFFHSGRGSALCGGDFEVMYQTSTSCQKRILMQSPFSYGILTYLYQPCRLPYVQYHISANDKAKDQFVAFECDFSSLGRISPGLLCS